MAKKSGLRGGVSFIGKVFEWLIFIVLIITTLIVLSPILPTKRYIYSYVVATGSMEKTISTGSIAFVQPVKEENLQKGDIITFTSPENPKLTVIHRVFAVKEVNHSRYFLTKGDNNNAPDNWKVPGTTVKGKYLFSIPYIGRIGTYAKTPIGFTEIIIFPALILVFFQILTIKKGIEEEVERRTKIAIKKAGVKDDKSPIKNIILLIFIINSLLIYGVHSIVLAIFVSSATASKISFSVIDFRPPSKPTGLKFINPDINCGGNTGSTTFTADWDNSTAQGSKTIAYYEFQSFSPPNGTTWKQTTTTVSNYSDSFTLGEGTYGFRVRSVDNKGYKSDWSAVNFTGSCQVTYKKISENKKTKCEKKDNKDNDDERDNDSKEKRKNDLLSKHDCSDKRKNKDDEKKPHIKYTVSDDKKTATLYLEHIHGFKKFSYSFEYDSYKNKRGIIASDIDINGKDSYSKTIDLATCSSTYTDNGNGSEKEKRECTYDKDTKNFKFRSTFTDSHGSETALED